MRTHKLAIAHPLVWPQNPRDMKRAQSNPERVSSKRPRSSKPVAAPAPDPTLLAVYERMLLDTRANWNPHSIASWGAHRRFRAPIPMAFATDGILNAVADVIAFTGRDYPGRVGVPTLRNSLAAAWIERESANCRASHITAELVFVLKRRAVVKHFFTDFARTRWCPRIQYLEHREGYCVFGIIIDPPRPPDGFQPDVRDSFWQRTDSKKREIQYNMLAADKCVCRPGCSHWLRTWFPCYLLLTLRLPTHIVASLTTPAQLDRMHFASVYTSSCWLTAPPPKTRALPAAS